MPRSEMLCSCWPTWDDGARRKADIPVAMSAPQNAGTFGKTVWFAGNSAELTDKPISPPGALKIGRARSFAWKQPPELGKRVWKRKFVSVKNVDNHRNLRLDTGAQHTTSSALGKQPDKHGSMLFHQTAACIPTGLNLWVHTADAVR